MKKEKEIDLNEEKNYKINISPSNLKWWGGIAATLVIGLITASLWISNLNQKIDNLDSLVKEFKEYKEKTDEKNRELNSRVERYIDIMSGNISEPSDFQSLTCTEINERIIFLINIKRKNCDQSE